MEDEIDDEDGVAAEEGEAIQTCKGLSRLRLNEDDIEAIAAAIQLGAFISSAVASRGFDGRSYKIWLKRGREAEKKLGRKDEKGRRIRLKKADKMCALFVRRVRQAEGLLKCEAESTLYGAACGNPEVMLQFLSRRFRDDWGERKKTQQEMEHEQTVARTAGGVVGIMGANPQVLIAGPAPRQIEAAKVEANDGE